MRVGYIIVSREIIFVFIEIHPPPPVEFPRLGFAFFGRCEMIMLLILCMLPDLVFG
jgi:hypothetical protein